MRRQLRVLLIPAALLFCLAVGLVGGVALDRTWTAASAPANATPASAAAQFRLMAEAWGIIQGHYVDHSALDPNRLAYGAIAGMTDSLGDTGHSRFLSPDLLKAEHDAIQGQFEGIGAEVQMKDGHVVIVAPLDGSPAQKAGLQPGDIILRVDGQDTTGQSLEEVVQRVLGPAGTPVTLTLLPAQGGQPREVRLIRARIKLQDVTWRQLPGTRLAHVRVASFSDGATADLKKALAEIQSQSLGGIILDLRNNPGGLLDEAVATASQFLQSGTVLQERDAQGQVKPVAVKPGGTATGIPLVLLVNGGSASAAEIVVGALQDAGRAKAVGETTFGTGTVLDEFSLSDGSALLLATEEWLTPKGRLIWHHGITPDLPVVLAAGQAPLFPEAEQGMSASQLQSSGDAQLLQAIQALQGVSRP